MKLFGWLAIALHVGKGDAFVYSPMAARFRGRASRDSRETRSSSRSRASMAAQDDLRTAAATCSLAAVLLLGSPLLPTLSRPEPAAAISGGGLDYSGLNLTGQDFSKGKYKSKDFSGAIAKEVSFKESDLRGARFFKADLKEADFTGANLGTASLEEADLDGAVLTNAVATGSYFGNNLGNVGDISGADFTDALIRKDNAKALCARPDAKGTNPTTGTDTRDSLLCDMF